MGRRSLQIFQIISCFLITWYVISAGGRLHWFIPILITAFAILNVAVVWMLREYRPFLATVCHLRWVRKYVEAVCFFTSDQFPLTTKSDSEVLLRSKQDFERACGTAKQLVRGHNGVVDTIFLKIGENQILRQSRRQKDTAVPMASFFLVGRNGIGKKYLMRVLSKLLYGTASVELFDCARLTPETLIGSRDREGELLERVRRSPRKLLIFEHIEKAPPDVIPLIVQILTKGTLRQPGSHSHVSFQNSIVAILTTQASDALAASRNTSSKAAGHHQRMLEIIGEETLVDAVLLNAVTEICFFQQPGDLVKAEVVALLMVKECRAHDIELCHVDPKIIAVQVIQIEEAFGFQLVPQHVRKVLRKPLVAAGSQQETMLSLRLGNSEI